MKEKKIELIVKELVGLDSDINAKFAAFKIKTDKIPERQRKILEVHWDKLFKNYDTLQTYAKEYKVFVDDSLDHEALSDDNTANDDRKLKDLNDEIEKLEETQSKLKPVDIDKELTTGGGKAASKKIEIESKERTDITERITEIENKKNKYIDSKKPKKPDFPALKGMHLDVAELKALGEDSEKDEFLEGLDIDMDKNTWSKSFLRSLVKEHEKEAEADFLESWAKEDQFDLLQNLQFGTVSFDYRKVRKSGENLHFPKALEKSMKTDKSFKFHKKLKNGGVELLNTNESQRIRVFRSAVDGKNVRANAIVYDLENGIPKTEQYAIITNAKLV